VFATLTTAPAADTPHPAATAQDTSTPKSSPPAPQSTRSPETTTRLASTKPSAQQIYDTEISRLLVIVNQRRGQLDTATLAVIEKNLHIIDDAITQCKQALRKDPASRFLMESLNDALDTKVQLLRTAAMLPSRT
jgi:hypothetical protein